MSRQTICDRCGKVVEPIGPMSPKKDRINIAFTTDILLDLCQSCVASLEKWLKSGQVTK